MAESLLGVVMEIWWLCEVTFTAN